MSDNRSDWQDDDIVPLGQIRPSREAFGPLAKSAKPVRPVSKGKVNGNGQPPARRPQGNGGQAQGRSPQPGSAQRSKAAPPPRSAEGRPAQRPAARNASVPARRPQNAAPPAQRAGRDDFANGLSARQKTATPLGPTSGWRGAVHKASGGVLNPGLSAAERHDIELRHQLRRPLTDGTVAVFSRKGGVGKTTISAYLGLTLARERGGRIVALDGDAEAGSLGWLLAPEARSTLAALASANPTPNDYASLRRYTASTPEGLEVIVGDPAEMGPISTVGLEAVADQLSRHYDVSIFDTGAGVTRATGRVLVNSARVLLLVMGPSVDSVRAAERTLAWIEERPGEAADADVQVIAVINGVPTNGKQAEIDRIESHFADRCRAVVRIPWDAHLAAGNTSVSLDKLAKPTQRAFMELAATTVTTLARPARHSSRGARRAS